jgi:hypothetical protein
MSTEIVGGYYLVVRGGATLASWRAPSGHSIGVNEILFWRLADSRRRASSTWSAWPRLARTHEWILRRSEERIDPPMGEPRHERFQKISKHDRSG